MGRPQPIAFVVVAFLALGLLGQLIPLYTDWLWFQEVGYTQVFTTTLSLRGTAPRTMITTINAMMIDATHAKRGLELVKAATSIVSTVMKSPISASNSLRKMI